MSFNSNGMKQNPDVIRRKQIQYAAEVSGLADLLVEPRTLDELATFRFDERATEIVLYALMHMSPPLVSYRDGAYRWIGPRSESDELFRFEMQRRWLQLTDVLKTGQPAGDMEPWFFRMLTQSMRSSAQEMMPDVLRYVQQHIRPSLRGIDVGGNHGLFSDTLQKVGYPMLVVDLPQALAKSHTVERVKVPGHDLLKGPLEVDQKYDWALLVRFVRMLGPNEISVAVENLSYALTEKAKLILVDEVRDLSQTADIVGVNMILNTAHGNTYSLDQIAHYFYPWGIHDKTELSNDYVATVWTRTISNTLA
jgi:hypothetical protein